MVYPNFSTYTDDRGAAPIHTFMINSVEIARYMASEFGVGCHNKKIPDWIRNLPSPYLKILLSSMMNGDGSTRIMENNKNRYCYTTSSEKLSKDISFGINVSANFFRVNMYMLFFNLKNIRASVQFW